MRMLIALIVTVFLWTVAANAAVTISETKAGGRTAVVLENDFLRMTFAPEKGGECTAFLYKPTNKQLLLADEGSLLGSRVWNYADKELYNQWQQNPWEYEIKRGATEVTLTMRAPGQVGFTRSTLFEKRVTLRDGEAMARVEHVFHVGQELMVPQKIGLWFFNKCGVVGEQNVYCFPLDDGIVTVDPAAGVNQEWFYNPSRGWAAAVGASGDGLCFNMEYRRLMCFYMCQGRQPTFEWAFRTTDIPNGDSLRTEELIVPFSGLKRVHGSGGGIVAGFDAPAKCAPADAQKGVPVKAILTAGSAQSGELTVDAKRLPDGQPQTVCKQEVTLAPAKTSTAEFQFKAEQEGTWLLTGHVSVGGKEVMDFMTPIVVGAESAPVRIAAKEERIGRPTERFEDQVPVRGTAPKDVELSMNVESPHVAWAKPYHKGKLRVMVLTSCMNGREAVELAERMDMEIIWVSAGTQSELDSYSGIFGPGKSFKIEHMNQYIKENLARPCDVILIGGLRADLFTDEVLDLFRRKVEEGVGLVYVAPNHAPEKAPEKLYGLLPLEKEIHPRRHDGEWQANLPHFITVGIPFAELPRTDYAEFRAKNEPLAKIGKAPLVVAEEGPGKGRVVVLTYNTGWQGNGTWKCGITPWLRANDQGSDRQPRAMQEVRFSYWEYHFSLLIKSLLWSAKREPDVALREVLVDTSAAAPKLTIKASNPGAALSAQAAVKVSDAFGIVESETTSDIQLTQGECSLALYFPENLPGGLHLADVIIKADGKVVIWGSAAFHLDRGVRITKVAFDKKAYHPGETAEVAVETTSTQEDDGNLVVRAEFTDSLGRLLARSEQKPTRNPVSDRNRVSRASFGIAITKPLATVLKVRVTALRGEQPLSVAETDAITLPEKFVARAWDDWESCVWGTAAGAYERDYLIPTRARIFKEYGFTTVLAAAQWAYDTEFDDAVRAGFQIMPMNVSFGALNVGHRAPKGKIPFETARTEYQKTHDKKYLVRPTCLNNPDDLKDTGDRLRKLAEFCGWLEPVGYNLGDEMGTTHYVTPFDYDFGDVCLGVFRKWLQERYGALDALNLEWETTFASWEQVMPMTAFEVKDRKNYAPWADHREFMDVTFANFFKWVRDTLREKDPRAGVGMSGSQAAEAYGGYDWWRLMHTLDFIQNYTHQDTPVMQRSFNADVPRVPWYGYQVVNPVMRQFLWRNLLNGSVGGSYFSDSYTFLPDLTMTQSTKDAFEVVSEMQAGVAKLLRNAERVNDIGIHYSHPSIRGAFITGADAQFRDNRGGWVQSVQDAGFQCAMLSTAQIEAGELARRNYRVFILPYSVALTEKEAAALRQYVEAGGVLIADAKVGLMDEHCRTLKAARLDDLFGVTRAQVDPSAGSREGEARFSQDRGECKLSGLTLDVSVAEPDLKVADGTGLGKHGETPVVIVKQQGKGLAVLLNFFLDGYPRRRELHVEKPLAQFVENLLRLGGMQPEVRVSVPLVAGNQWSPHFYIVRYRSGPAQYVAIQYDTTTEKKAEAVKAAIALPPSRCVYDVRAGETLGETTKVETVIQPGDTKLYALLPYSVKSVALRSEKDSVKAGDVVRYNVNVECDGGQPGLHVFRIEVLGPDGQPRAHYGAKLLAEKGSISGEIPLALNDSPGKWTLRATDIATKRTGTCEFTVAP